jgi:ribosomal protein S18 acetylase RimI-like enzyme
MSSQINRLFVVRRQLIFSRSLDASNAIGQSPLGIEPLEFRFPVDQETLESLVFEAGERERTAIQQYLQKGEQLAVIVDGDVVACRGLVRSSGYISLEGDRQFRALQSGELFIHYCRTNSDYRGKRLYPELLVQIVDILREDRTGTHISISCRANNTPSIKGILRSDFTLKHEAWTLGFLGGRLAVTRLAPISRNVVDEGNR